MKKEIEFEDFAKLKLVVGEVKGKEVDIGEKSFSINSDLDVKNKDKIVVGLLEEGIVIPVAGDSVISVDSDIDSGSVVG